MFFNPQSSIHNPQFLDLGTGSGILALAAKLLGATCVEAIDFDPHAVRTAKENARLNGIRGVKFSRADVLAWEPARTWPIVAANLFSQVLIEASPAITRAVAPGGVLILSGILRAQAKETSAAFQQKGFRIEKTLRNGKWVSFQMRK